MTTTIRKRALIAAVALAAGAVGATGLLASRRDDPIAPRALEPPVSREAVREAVRPPADVERPTPPLAAGGRSGPAPAPALEPAPPRPAPAPAAASPDPAEPAPPRPAPARAAAPPAPARPDGERRELVAAAKRELLALYGYVGEVDLDGARALIAGRKAAAEAIAARLAALGPGGARAIEDDFDEGDPTRARLLLVTALGAIDDPEAPAVLRTLLDREPTFIVKREVLLALGRCGEPAAAAALDGVLATEPDPQLRIAAVHAASRHPTVVDALARCAGADADAAVRLEAVRALGRAGSAAAHAALEGIAGRPDIDPAVRRAAARELARPASTPRRRATR
jgi:hypothetical protein